MVCGTWRYCCHTRLGTGTRGSSTSVEEITDSCFMPRSNTYSFYAVPIALLGALCSRSSRGPKESKTESPSIGLATFQATRSRADPHLLTVLKS